MNHAQQAEDHIDWVHQWQEIEGSTDATEIAGAILAQVHATLALAEQQRIANLIALLQYTGRIPEAAAHEIQDELFAAGGALADATREALELGDPE